MRRALMTAVTLLFVTALASGQQKSFDYQNLTAEDIAELKAARHAFYAAESAAKEKAIKEQLRLGKANFDGNQNDYDIRYYGINVRLDFTASTIIGRIDYKIRSGVPALSAVDLNLHHQLIVDSVKVGGAAATFSRPGELLSITTPTSYGTNAEFNMSVYYHGTPYFDGQQGMAFGSVSGYLMCYTNCEPFASRNWWPCKDYPLDKPDSIDLYIDYPSTYKLVTAGLMISDDPNGTGRKLVHYKHRYPIATYLVALTCANFIVGNQTWTYPPSYSMPVVTYTLPNATAAKNSFDTWMLPVLTKLSDAFGVYPFVTEKAGNAHFGWGGAMEHQTCSFYNSTFYNDWVIAHETGHQWFGDMITCEDFHHVWINEGLASYTEPIFFERYYNSLQTYLDYMQSQKYLGPGTVYVENLQTDDIFDNNLSYDKGSWIMHMLRGVLGDTVFFQVMRDYYNSQYKYGSLTTEEFSSQVSGTVGSDMYWFFHEWVYGEGHPDYKISWECKPAASGYSLVYFIRQVQTGGTYFKMPIKTTFVTTGGSKDTVIWNQGGGEVYTLAFADSVTNIIFDPQEWILRTVVTEPFGLHITSRTLPDGALTVPYFQKLGAVGGVPPYHWTKVGGDLPLGLDFNGDTIGTIYGTPTWPADYFFTLRLTDSKVPANTEMLQYTLTIGAAPRPIGDANNDGMINITDVIYLVGYIFSGGPAPDPLRIGDADCNGLVNISDAVFLVNYIFGSGPAPNCP